MTEPMLGLEKPRTLPKPRGKLAKEYAAIGEMGMGKGPNLYVLDTVESAIEQVQSLFERKGKKFDVDQGLITFACADAIDERCIAENYLSRQIKMVRDGLARIPASHYENLHFYDQSISEETEHLFEAIGNSHQVDIFKALVQSRDPEIDTPQASLFFLKGIEFFREGNVYSDKMGKKLKIFRRYLPNFLNDEALVFINAGSPALKDLSGFTQIHTGDREIEEASGLDVYLYQRPSMRTAQNVLK